MKRIRSESIALSELIAWKKAEELLPEYTEKQYLDLVEFVQNGGQIPPVVISESKQVIDGYNRWRLATRLNLTQVECDVYTYENEDEMELHAIVLNAKRRHLNKLQVARAAVRLSTLIKADQDDEQEQVDAVEETVETDSAPEMTSTDMLEAPKPEVEAVPEPEPEEKEASFDEIKAFNKKIQAASHKLGVPQSLIKQVKKIDETQDGVLIQAMEEKQITIKKAAEIAELPEEDRAQAIINECEKSSNETQKHVTAVVKSCSSFIKKIKACKKDFSLDGIPEDDVITVKESMSEIINEAQELLDAINQPPAATEPTQ